MTAQKYVQSKLDSLKLVPNIVKPAERNLLAELIFRTVMSKKFRKYSVNSEYVDHIRPAITLCLSRHEPIKFSMVFGGYKLWRLEESPEVDWAELFSMIYYTDWVKSICAVYKPGVWFEYFSDDSIVPKIENVPLGDTARYIQSFRNLLAFLKPYLPENLDMTLTRVAEQYKSEKDFEDDLATNYKELQSSIGLPKLNDELRATLDLNVKLTPEQKQDPKWREKVQLLHDAYAQVSWRRPYYRRPDKLMVVPVPIPNAITVGTTKDSIMKFWIGTGALRQIEDSFRQVILSPNQLKQSRFSYQDINIPNLQSKNFAKIRIIQS